MNPIGRLRNMTSVYLTHNDRILLLFRQGSRVVNDKWIGSAGGHFEPQELNDAYACAMVLGDNIFYGNGFGKTLRAATENAEKNNRATVFGLLIRSAIPSVTLKKMQMCLLSLRQSKTRCSHV